MRRKGPGFNPRVERELKRIDRRLELAFCRKRRFWLVVRKTGPLQSAWWSGIRHAGYEVVLRWSGMHGKYGTPTRHGEPGFLPLDARLVAKIRHGNLSALGHKARLADKLARIDRRRLKTKAERRISRAEQARDFYAARHERNVEKSIPGLNPGDANDYETEREAIAKLSGRARAAFLRARGGRLPPHLRELERHMAERGL